jgi:ATP-dependent Lhr-like helicase
LESDKGIAAEATPATALAWLVEEVGIAEPAARQIVDYLGSAKAALGLLPTQQELAMERFFDESGGTQLIIHSPFGSRVNRAWGLALRKRFCRKFNFELQAAATEDAIVLSLSTSHSFPLEDVARYLHSESVRDVLIQALLDAPMFGVRWRWNATTALALPRFQGGSKVPPQLQRMKSEDLLATVFPDQVACAENLVGEREIPDHPLVEQTLHDCLHEAMDIDGLIALLKGLEQGTVRIVARDLTGPSPLAAEILGARPYAFLDDAPLEERRTQAVANRRWSDPESVDDLGRLDPDAIAAVREEAWPEARSADELHAALMGVAFVTDAEVSATYGWSEWLAKLAADRRVTRLQAGAAGAASAATAFKPAPSRGGLGLDDEANNVAAEAAPTDRGASVRNQGGLWIPAERLPQFDAIVPAAQREPVIDAPAEYAAAAWTREDALVDVLRARLTALGPTRVSALAQSLGIAPSDIEMALLALESEGFVMRGRFSASALAADSEIEWSERHLLARIHRYTVKRLRREIEPVEPRDFMRFLFEWQRVAPGTQVSGPDALAGVLVQLEAFEAAASAWESEILPARVAGYEIAWLDALCQAGRVVWTRLRGRKASSGERAGGPVRATPVVLLQRSHRAAWLSFGGLAADVELPLSSRAQAVADYLGAHGASFFDELLSGTRLLHTELENALGELVAVGLVNADSFTGLRALLVPSSKRPSAQRRHGRRRSLFGIEDAGRWSLVRRATAPVDDRNHRPKFDADALEHTARVLLKRYGVVCWRLLAHEADWLPPWRELLRVYHRLEARGEIRGGRFIAGVAGEQFALPEAIASLRSLRQRAPDDTFVCICGADPLNLVGSLIAGDKVPRLVGSRVLYRDGLPVATRVAGKTQLLGAVHAADEHALRMRILRGAERMLAPHAHATDSGEEE